MLGERTMHVFGVKSHKQTTERSPFSPGCRVWNVQLPRVLQDDSDALIYARPHSLRRTRAGGLLMNRYLQWWLLWHTGVFRGCRRKLEHRAL